MSHLFPVHVLWKSSVLIGESRPRLPKVSVTLPKAGKGIFPRQKRNKVKSAKKQVAEMKRENVLS